MNKSRIFTELQYNLDWLKSLYKNRYGNAIFDLSCRSDLTKSEAIITGSVLLPTQLCAAQALIAKYLKGKIRCYSDVRVLSDTDSFGQTYYGRPGTEILNVYNRPQMYSPSKSYWGQFLSCQITVADRPFYILLEYRGWLLIKLDDFTVGWVQKEFVDVNSKERIIMRPWQISIGYKNIPSHQRSAILIERAMRYIGAPYVLGGVTSSGMDCSGLIRRVYMDSFGVNLPKHSRNQLSLGKIVPFERRREGDIVFFGHKHNYNLHVGLIYNAGKVIHASGHHGMVSTDELSTLISKFNIVQVRRMEWEACEAG